MAGGALTRAEAAHPNPPRPENGPTLEPPPPCTSLGDGLNCAHARVTCSLVAPAPPGRVAAHQSSASAAQRRARRVHEGDGHERCSTRPLPGAAPLHPLLGDRCFGYPAPARPLFRARVWREQRRERSAADHDPHATAPSQQAQPCTNCTRQPRRGAGTSAPAAPRPGLLDTDVRGRPRRAAFASRLLVAPVPAR